MSTATTGLPALPTGNYIFTLPNASYTSPSCLSYQDQMDAWDCASGATLNITIIMDNSTSPSISMSVPSSDQPLRYGAQPPLLNGPSALRLRKDKSQKWKGPAYWFSSQMYNKLVILHEEDLHGEDSPGTPPNTKRSILEGRNSAWWRNELVEPGHRPWFCFWNNTYLEGFIYLTVDEPVSGSTSSNTPSAPDSTAVVQTPAAAATCLPSRYPKVMRVRELRYASINGGSTAPYCQRMEILPSAQLGPGCGEPIALQENAAMTPTSYPTVTATDAVPTYTSYAPEVTSSPQVVPQQGQYLSGACMCNWIN